MADLKGTQVAAAIVPFTDLDTYATHDAEYGKGGFRSVDTNAKRDAIPAARKVKGMVVRVNDTGLHWTWTGSEWVEWLPKGSMLVDAALSTTSQNPVQNKVITNRINTIEDDTLALQNAIIELGDAVSGIPIITVDTIWNATSDNPASSKAIESTISPIRTTANQANAKADSALGTANAAIPKNYIDTALEDNASDTRVPSSKLLKDISFFITAGLQNAIDQANSAGSVANAAIPKSWIDSSIDGNETSNNSVPGTGAILTYINTGIGNRVTNLENWKNGIGNKNQANGVAGLDASGKISASQLPAGYDNVDKLIAFIASAPTSGMTIGQKWYITSTKKIFTATSATSGSSSDPIGNDMIYIDQNANKSYYWSGTDMVNIGSGNALALGLTHSTAFYGDYGNTLYTNFGTGTNLTGTQKARDFFKSIVPSNTPFIKEISLHRESSYVAINDSLVYFDGNTDAGDGVVIYGATSTQAGVMTADMFNTFQKLTDAVFPLILSTPTDTFTYEAGTSNNSSIPLTVTKGGVDVSSQITNYSIDGRAGSISSDKKTYTPSGSISSSTYVEIVYMLGSLSSNVLTVKWNFKYKKYWGTSTSTSLTNAQILALGGSTWADSRTMNSTEFDCTGGKYPYYVIPNDIYFYLEVWVGGLKNTDITVTDINLTNASGASKAYKVIRLTNIQTGILSIQFK